MSFNNFLSTSKAHDVSFAFAESNSISPDMMGILFIMTIDPFKSTTTFTSLKDKSEFDQEDDDIEKALSYHYIGWAKMLKENIERQFYIMKKPLKFDNNHFLRIILIWPNPTIVSVWYMAAWVIIRMLRYPINALWPLHNNHYRQITLICKCIETTLTE